MSSPKARAVRVAGNEATQRRFVFLLLDHFTMLSFAGAIEPLRIANRVLGRQAYVWKLEGENGREVTCSTDASFNFDMGLEEIERDDTVLVCAGIDVRHGTTRRDTNALRREA